MPTAPTAEVTRLVRGPPAIVAARRESPMSRHRESFERIGTSIVTTITFYVLVPILPSTRPTGALVTPSLRKPPTDPNALMASLTAGRRLGSPPLRAL